MTGGARVRFWIESIVGGAAGFLALLTVFWRDWLKQASAGIRIITTDRPSG